MKLVHRDIEQHFDFAASAVWQLVVEDSKHLYALVNSLFAQLHGDDGGFVLSHDNKELKLDGNAYIVFEPFTIDPNISRTVFNKLIASLRTTAYGEEHMQSTNELMSRISEYTYTLLDAQHYSFDITAGTDFTLDDLLKALKPHIELPDGSAAERLVDYFAAVRDLFGIRLFVLPNFSNYLNLTDMNKLANQIACDGHNVLFVEKNAVPLSVPTITITSDLSEL
ncbi:MAG: type II-A CRISPR-associated protein Csn2 [Coriobacteriales bacterium]|jgi:CRISPR type II-A-associated protein Csn2|nr:type II-A CRISPR-associated protein Csn2 [Coriobacteriales bacterium]